MALSLPTVCVTGGGGFVATELIHQLLCKGYNVRATVRSKSDNSKVAHLEALAAALPGTLELTEADLLKEGAFDDAFRGCRYVFHTASPFFIEAGDPQAELVDPAVKGTRNVMAAVAKKQGGCAAGGADIIMRSHQGHGQPDTPQGWDHPQRGRLE